MAATPNLAKEGLEEKKSRLLQELEELKQAESVRDLERQLEERKAAQKIKELERQVEELKQVERIKELKREVEETRNRAQLYPESSCGEASTRDPYTLPSAGINRSPNFVPTEGVRGPEHQAETTRENTKKAHGGQPTLPTPVNSGADQGDSPTRDCHIQASTQINPRPNLTPVRMDHQTGSHIIQQASRAPADISGATPGARRPSTSGATDTGLDMEAATLQYYQELDGPADDSPELLFYDMDLKQLYEFASILEENQENNIEEVKLLSRVYYFIFMRTGTVGNIQKAIQRAQEAVEATHTDSPDYAPCLRVLVVILMKKYERTSSLEDLNQAILFAEVMLTVTPPRHPDRLDRLIDLMKMKYKKALQIRSTEDFDEAMVMAIEAMSMVQGEGGGQAGYHLNKFKETGDLNDLRMAVSGAEEAVAATPRDHPDRAARLSNLGISLWTRFERTGDVNDLNMAIEKGRKAVEATPRDYPDRAEGLTNWEFPFGPGGEAVKATPCDHPDRVGRLINLAASLLTRFQRTGDVNDLNMAIERNEEAVEAVPRDYPDQADMLTNLAVSFSIKYERTGDLSDLKMAIEKGGEAVEVTPSGHPRQAQMLTNLAISFWRRFERTGDVNDFNMAIEKGGEAVEATPRDRPDQAAMLTSLGIFFSIRFKRTGDVNDFNIAIERGGEAVEATPRDRPDRAGKLNNLAISLRIRFGRTGAQSDSERALSLWVKATESPNAAPRMRISLASSAAEILADNKNWAEASRITEIAVNLLPTVAPHQLKQQDQQHILGEFAGLTALAASAALEAGKEASHAVQLLELGRAVIAGLRFGTRSDITKLKEQYPETAEKFERFRDILDSPSPSVLDPTTARGPLSSEQGTSQRHNAGFELDKIIDQIRNLPNFENFLRPPKANELKAAASLGPVVLINVSKYRCDAFLVERQAIRSMRLPDLHQSDIEKNVQLTRSTRSAHALSSSATSQMSRMLEWLWDVAVGPILDELGFRESPADNNWPCIWWIPTGSLSSLPLHAAGRHFPPSIETALDRVVSSYSPSIKALLHARQNSQEDS
ncbi:hypothetical protein DL768_004780 [Monosporascus sp. mg162]|nr:hypothetical protein DL768_004780 [Monosporascus sp. mg162]